jgi:hypothetical protein
MLEGYTARLRRRRDLADPAAHLVSGVTYRHPGVLAKP